MFVGRGRWQGHELHWIFPFSRSLGRTTGKKEKK